MLRVRSCVIWVRKIPRPGGLAMTESKSILVIGGGHNGLVCATYLAKAGHRV